ncbi:MAG: hypothetical protein ACI83P_000419 [Janthinobacterium sp.]|jgi:hypothetical protein
MKPVDIISIQNFLALINQVQNGPDHQRDAPCIAGDPG